MLLYAVVPADATPSERRGLLGGRLETIRGALAAVIAEESSGRLDATGDESRAFAKIICDLATTIPMLPIRFPTMLPYTISSSGRASSQGSRVASETH